MTMARDDDRDVERAETAALLGDDGDARGDGRGRARGGTTRGTTRTAMVVGGACALAACASIGVWTHRSETLQEAWRPVPGEELAMRARGARAGGASIARWGTTSTERARLGADAATGVTPTPTQMTALRGLRLQIRNAMFNPGTVTSQTLSTMTNQFFNIVPQARALFPTGAPANIDDLDATIKSLMANGAMAAPAAPAAESEFRDMLASSHPTGVSMPIDVSTEPTAQQQLRPRKPLTSYESALYETRQAASQVSERSDIASTGAPHHHSHRVSSETQTVIENDNLERMINSLDASGAEEVDKIEPYRAPSGDFIEYSNGDSTRHHRRHHHSSNGEEVEAPQDAVSTGPALPPWAAQPTAAAQVQQPIQQWTGTGSVVQSGQAMPLATPVPATTTAPAQQEDASWTDFQNLMSAAPTPDAPTPTPVPTPTPMPADEPSDIKDLLDFGAPTTSPQVEVTASATPTPTPSASDDESDIVDLFTNGGGEEKDTGGLGEDVASATDDSTAPASMLRRPVFPTADAEAIASHIVDMIMHRKSSDQGEDDAADIGLDQSGSAEKKSQDAPNLSKEEIAAMLASSLTAVTTEAVQANALENARVSDASNGSANAKIMADALVAHDKMMAKRIAEILTSENAEDKLANPNAAASIGSATGYDVSGRSGEAAQLIMYEEQRHQREEVEAMRRDLAALMANIQANYAMGATEDRIDKTASAAASHIIDTLRPVIKTDVAREGSSESSTLFDYPVMPSSSLSSETLRLDSIDDDSYDDVGSAEAKAKAKATSKDDDGAASGDWLALLEEDAGGASAAATPSAPAPAPAKKSSDGVDASSSNSEEDVSVPGDNGATGDQPAWLAHALTDEQLTAQFLADEVEDDGEATRKRSRKHRASRLGASQRFTAPTPVVRDEPTRETKQGAYVRALNERAARALRHD